jgi:hypothetical protein
LNKKLIRISCQQKTAYLRFLRGFGFLYFIICKEIKNDRSSLNCIKKLLSIWRWGESLLATGRSAKSRLRCKTLRQLGFCLTLRSDSLFPHTKPATRATPQWLFLARLQVFATTEVRCRFFGEGVVLVKEVSFYRRGVSYVSFQGRYRIDINSSFKSTENALSGFMTE